MTVEAASAAPTVGTGELSYNMEVVAGELGGTTEVTISPAFTITGISPRFTSCRVSSGDNGLYVITQLNDDICFDRIRLMVEQTLSGETIGFSMRTFRFSSEALPTDAQEQTISCDLYLEPAEGFVYQPPVDCSCAIMPERCQ